jgi:Tol biopolymer transport system component
MTHAHFQPTRRRLLAAGAVALALVALWVGGSVAAGPAAAPTMPGRLAYVVGGNIWIWQGSSGRQITKGGQDGAPALSPDGSRLAYIRYDYSFSDLVISPSGGGEPQFLTDNRPPGETGSKDFVDKAVWALEPAWTGDGAGLTYTSDLGTDAPVLWAMDADGGNAHQLRTSPPAPPLEHPRSAPDGSILASSFGSG